MSSPTTNRRAWRFRRCPSCRTVHPAGDYTAVRYGPSWQHGAIPRRCPSYGYVGATFKFQVVRERHP